MTDVYIITRGEYSSYEIVAVFLDKEKAKSFVGIANEVKSWYSQCDIETYSTDDYDNIPDDGYYEIKIYMDIKGNVLDTKIERVLEKTETDQALTVYKGKRCLVCRTTHRTEDITKATKIASDALAKFKAIGWNR